MARAAQIPLPRSSTNESFEYISITRERALRSISEVIQNSYPETPVFEAPHFHNTDAELAWVIEPIDGTSNFSRRLDTFCSLIGIYIQGKLEHGVVIDHFRDGQWVVSRTHGAFGPLGRMRVSELRTLPQGLIAGDDPSLLEQLKTLQLTSHITGSSILDLTHTCSGRMDCMLMSRVSSFQFDFCRLFARESGGFASTLSGGEWTNSNDGLVAGNTYVYRRVISSLRQQTCEAPSETSE